MSRPTRRSTTDVVFVAGIVELELVWQQSLLQGGRVVRGGIGIAEIK